MDTSIEKWDFFELELTGPKGGNPFVDVRFGAAFRQGHRCVEVDGFYDGDGAYRVRFMPDTEGEWTCETCSNRAELAGRKASFRCVSPGPGNHGPVLVSNRFHFAHADGTPHKSVGTTCYAWVHQGDALEEQTLATLRQAPFNKLRFCVFPKDYDYNRNDPERYPFVKAPPAEGERYGWDFTRFDPAFWRHFERRVGQLRDLGIEADIIVFHPYDRWGFARMPSEADDRYIRYLIARLAAFRNVWWSMANEYDFMQGKSAADWDRYFALFQRLDPYGRLRSIHNGHRFYDHARGWVTHASVQHSDLGKVPEWRAQYGKPVVVDECCYEGNNRHCWGNITGEELTRRCWRGCVGGGYVGHGETYVNPEEILWWSKGGRLVGSSPARIAFLRKVLEEGPAEGLEPCASRVVPAACEGCGCVGDGYFLAYFGIHQPASVQVHLPPGKRYRIEAIDTWNMTVQPVREAAEGSLEIELPGRPYIAVRIVARRP